MSVAVITIKEVQVVQTGNREIAVITEEKVKTAEIKTQQVAVITKKVVEIVEVGRVGMPGRGVPPGGLTSQILTKASDDDFDTEWQDPPVTGVISVFGRTGAVIAETGDYDTSQVPENGNLYFEDSRAIDALTGQDISIFNNDVGYISDLDSFTTDDLAEGSVNKYFSSALAIAAVVGVLAAPLTYNAGQIGIQTANASQPGALSAANWTTFNNKENAIAAGTTAQYWRGDKTFQTLNTAVVPESGNLYYTQGRFDVAFGNKTTSNLSEGSNKYYTDLRADTRADLRIAANSGVIGGFAPLDGGLKIPSGYLPAIAITDTFVVGSQAAMLALSAAETGDVAVRTDLNKSFILKANPYSVLANWQELLTPPNAVLSVNGFTGAVTLGTGNISETGGNLYFTDERAQDAVGNILTDTATIDFNYDDAGGSITAIVKAGSITDSLVAAGIDAAKIGAGAVSNAEYGYLDGVTSAIQTQLNGKQAIGNYITALTGDGTAAGPGSAALTLATVNSNVGTFQGLTVNAKGQVTAAVNQNYITNTSGLFVNNATNLTLTRAGSGPYTLGINLANVNTWTGQQTFSTSPPIFSTGTASRAVYLDGSKQLATSATTSTELGYLAGVTSAIQTQLNAKVPASPDRGVQYNNGGAWGASTALVWSTDKELIITGDPSTYVADPTGMIVTLEYDAGYAYDNTNKYNVDALVYAYRIVGGTKYFSATYTTASGETANQSGINFRTAMSWDAVPGADGYRVVLLNDSFPTSPTGPPDAPFNYDYYVDVATNSLTDDDDQVYVPYVDGVNNIPIGAANTAKNLWVKGNVLVEQFSNFQGRVAIDTTGAATTASEALHVYQNAQIDGVLGVGGVANPDNFINISKTLVLTDGTVKRGLSIAMVGAGAADTTGAMEGINIGVTGSSAHTNGGITGATIAVSDASNSTGALVGANIAVSSSGNSASPSQMYGIFFAASKVSPGTMSIIDGARFNVNIGAGGNIGDAYGAEFLMSDNSYNSAANITTAKGVSAVLSLNGPGTNTQASAGFFKLYLAKGGSTVGTSANAAIIRGELNVLGGFQPTNLFGLYMPNIAGGTNNYSAWFDGGNMYHKGAVGINIAAAAKLHVVETTEQMRLGYDAANKVSFVVGSSGILDITPTGARITLGKPANLKNYTVATLPAGVRGDICYVTDALTPTFLVAVVGGGAAVSPVFYNGAAWVAI